MRFILIPHLSKTIRRLSCNLLVKFVLQWSSILLTVSASAILLMPVSGDTRTKDRSETTAKAFTSKRLEPYTETLPKTLVKFEMVPIRGGVLEMPDPANPGKKQRIKIRDFWIGKTEVTWDEYDVYLYGLDLADNEEDPQSGPDAISRPSKPYGSPDRGFGHEGYPAIGMTYLAAEQYCRWLSIKTGKRYRLPTEAEWEHACRARVLPSGPIRNKLEKLAWFWDNSDDKTHPVAKKQPNAWGLYDMLGNTAEWCKGRDGTPVVCGGSYRDSAEKVHPAARQRQTPGWNANDPQNPKSKWWLSDAPFVGFRVLREE